MSVVDVTNHDIKIFFRRLQVPAELVDNNLVSPSAAVGQDPDSQKENLRRISDEDLTKPVKFDKSQPAKVFADYEPSAFRPQLIAKATASMQSFVDNLNSKKLLLGVALQDKRDAQANKNIFTSVSNKTLIDSSTSKALVATKESLEKSLSDVDVAASSSVPPGSSPRVRDRTLLFTLRVTIDDIRKSIGLTNLSNLERNTLDLIQQNIDAIIDKSLDQTTYAQERQARTDIITGINNLLALRAIEDSIQDSINDLNRLIQGIDAQINSLSDEIRILQVDTDKLTPFYEPILLNSLLGATTCTTSINRLGQPGHASISFTLPLESQGVVPDLFLAIEDNQVFDIEILEQSPNFKGNSSTAPSGQDHKSSFVPSRTLNILKPNLRETTLRPFDMIQVWMRRRFAEGSRFPNDYYPTFTGFVTKTGVNYSGGSITVTVDAEDTAKIMRIARVNIDPAVLPGFRAPGINITPYNNYLQSPTFTTGGSIIKALVQGAPGTFLGLSQAEVTVRQTERNLNGNSVLGSVVENVETQTEVFKLATEFDSMQLNIFEDLNNRWKPYTNQFKSAFKLWETDFRIKWDIAKEVAGITEFELYADNMGVINYHTPLYMLNPFDVQYLIQDLDIDDESHEIDEQRIMTVADISSQPSYISAADNDIIRRASSLVSAPESLIQRFGVRWAKKDVPIFSGIDNIRPKDSGVGNAFEPTDLDKARTTYARAWLNRRNMEAMSAQVTLNGVPEIRVCNTVAFVGSASERLKRMVKGQLVPLGQTSVVQKSLELAKKAAGLPGIPTQRPNIGIESVSRKQTSQLAVEGMKDILVYYVSEVTHMYVQGRQLKTKLTLTHGRHWTEPLPFGSVGFGLDALDNNDAVALARRVFGQDGANPAEFAQSLSNLLNFVSSGNPGFIPRATDGNDRSPFGMTGTKNVEPGSLDNVKTAGFIDPGVPKCKKLTRFPKPSVKKGVIKKAYEAMKDSLANLIKFNLPEFPKLNFSLGPFSLDAIKKALEKEKEKVDVDLDYTLLNALMKDNPTLKELIVLDSGALIPDEIASLLPEDTIEKLRDTLNPIVIYNYLSKSEDGTTDKAINLAESKALELSSLALNVPPSQIETLAMVGLITARKKGSKKINGESLIKEQIIVQGIIIMGRVDKC